MAEIVRGTTPTIKFRFSTIDPTSIVVGVFTAKIGNLTVIEKDLSDAVVDSEYISWKLTQEETLRFSRSRKATIVCDWKVGDGTRGRSKTATFDVTEPGKDEVI